MSVSEQEQRKSVGRPRSERSHQAIIQAAIELLSEVGFAAMSIEEVAARAGVGKTTIYRRWTSKLELVSEALRQVQMEIPVIDTGDVREDLIAILRHTFEVRSSLLEGLMLKVVNDVKRHPEVYQAMYDSLVTPRREKMLQFIEWAQARGELRTDIDPFLILGMIIGPVLYHLFWVGGFIPHEPFTPEQIVDTALQGIVTQEYLSRRRDS